MTDGNIAERLEALHERIGRACAEAGRDRSTVELVAVSKRHDADAIRAAYAAGCRVFGESYVQELEGKVPRLADLRDLRWRFIGHLQRNKVKSLLALKTPLAIDSLDSRRLADALEKQLQKQAPGQPASAGDGGDDDTVIPDANEPVAKPLDTKSHHTKSLSVLVQVNLGGETQKSGVDADALPALVEHIRALRWLRLDGLMTIPPADTEPDSYFEQLRSLAETHGLRTLSMGMSADLEAAIRQGATQVRVGTALFGPR